MEVEVEAVLFDAGGTLVLQHPELMGRVLGVKLEHDACFEAHYLAMDAYSRLHSGGDHRHGWEWWLEHYFANLGVPSPSEAGSIELVNGEWRTVPSVVDTIRLRRRVEWWTRNRWSGEFRFLTQMRIDTRPLPHGPEPAARSQQA